MRELVRGYADATFETAASELARVADELGALVLLLDSSGDLRSALASPGTPGPKRRAIVRELLAGKVLAATFEIVAFAVQTGAAGDFAQDVAALAAIAKARRDDEALPDEGPLGRTGALEKLEGYASAVLAPLRGQKALGDVEDELFRFSRTVLGDDQLRVALTTSELPIVVRRSVVRDLLEPRARRESSRLAGYATVVGRPRDYVVLLEALVDVVAREADRRVADVRSAIEMTRAQRDRLAAALSDYAGHRVDVRVVTEPGLLGGFVATMGDTVIDGSLRHRLDMAREILASTSARLGSPGRQAGSSTIERTNE